MLPPFSALIDANTSALLTLSTNIPVISFLAACSEAEHIPLVNYPNYRSHFPIAAANPDSYPQWTWNSYERTFLPTPSEMLTQRLRNASLLAVKKGRVLNEIAISIQTIRHAVFSGLVCQEQIYTAKKIEALCFKEHYVEGDFIDPIEYPYITQFAELSGLSPPNAAEEILLKARLADDILLKSEYFRLKYLDQLKTADDVALVDPILIEFRKEFRRSFKS